MKASGERFPEEELWKIADSTLKAMAFLQEKRIPFGDFSANDIVYTKNKVKFQPIKSLISHHAPDYVHSCAQYKADVLQLGEILLEATNLRFPRKDRFGDFDMASDNYSDFWVYFLKDLLHPDMHLRPSARQLMEDTSVS